MADVAELGMELIKALPAPGVLITVLVKTGIAEKLQGWSIAGLVIWSIALIFTVVARKIDQVAVLRSG
jgi:hypothetical protein